MMVADGEIEVESGEEVKIEVGLEVETSVAEIVFVDEADRIMGAAKRSEGWKLPNNFELDPVARLKLPALRKNISF